MTFVCMKHLCSHGNRVWRQTFPILYNSQHALTTSGQVQEKVNMAKMTRMLQKMIDKDKKKKWVGFSNMQVVDNDRGGGRKSKVTEGHRRRAVQVGKVLYDYISSIINSGELHPELVDSSVEVSKVVVVPDFSSVNVLWLASGTEKDVETQKLLDSCADKLRAILISLHVIGRVPKICFVHDLSEARINQLERLLKVADMGPEDEKTDSQGEESVVANNNRGLSQVSSSTKDRLSRDFKRLSLFSNTPGGWSVSGMSSLQDSSGMSQCSDVSSSELSDDEHITDNGQTDRPSQFQSSPGSEHFRHDIYGLNREQMVSKILLLKRKAKDRSVHFQPIEDTNDLETLDLPGKTTGSKGVRLRNKLPKQKAFYTFTDAVKDDELGWTEDLAGVSEEDIRDLHDEADYHWSDDEKHT